MINNVKNAFSKIPVNFHDNMLLIQKQPHTAPVAHLNECCCGRSTACYYFLARYFSAINDKTAVDLLTELSKLQITDEQSDFFGCCRWYREEDKISDSNGAFFVLLPIALTYLLCYDKITEKEKLIIKQLLSNASKWFSKQCQGELYYSNKIMSDGSMLSLIAYITGKYVDESNLFWKKWSAYACEFGMGWGENTSDCYSRIMLNALIVASLVTLDKDLNSMLKKQTTELIDYIAFHNGKEFVPSIRSYNFSGSIEYGGIIYKSFIEPDALNDFFDLITAVILYEAEIDVPDFFKSEPVRKEHIYDASYAYTWKGKNLRLGTVSAFPVMEGCYQNETWGLAWQSMPVSALIENNHVAFLKLRAISNDHEHSYPARDKHSAYLYNKLFEDNNIPDSRMLCMQKDNIAIVVRSMTHLANRASAIYDEWYIPETGTHKLYKTTFNNREWYIAEYDSCAIAILPLKTIAAVSEQREEPKVKIITNNNFSSIANVLYEGEETMLISDRLESAWIIVALDSKEYIESTLNNISIKDSVLHDSTLPRNSKTTKRYIECITDDNTVSIIYDPYKK